jgi:3-oxoacyl-[acyl-carrier protein] reductase
LSIVVNYASNEAEADAAVAAVGGQGREALGARADVADDQAVEALCDLAERAFGGVDVVVHAAGRLSLAPVVDLDLGVLDEMHGPLFGAPSWLTSRPQAGT